MQMGEYVGWIATLVFSGSYLCRGKNALLLIQMIAATIWICYGVAIHSRPVVVANLVVAISAGASALRGRRAPIQAEPSR